MRIVFNNISSEIQNVHDRVIGRKTNARGMCETLIRERPKRLSRDRIRTNDIHAPLRLRECRFAQRSAVGKINRARVVHRNARRSFKQLFFVEFHEHFGALGGILHSRAKNRCMCDIRHEERAMRRVVLDISRTAIRVSHDVVFSTIDEIEFTRPGRSVAHLKRLWMLKGSTDIRSFAGNGGLNDHIR